MDVAITAPPRLPTIRRVLHLLAFLTVAVVSLGSPMLHWVLLWKVLLGSLLLVPTAYMYIARIRLFVPSLFFAIYGITGPLVLSRLGQLPFHFPQLSLLPAILAYLAVTLSLPRLRCRLFWLRRGRFDRRTTRLTVVLMVGSTLALLAWALLITRNLSRFRQFAPAAPLPLLILYGVGFIVVNSCFEEFVARAVLFDGFASLFNSIVMVVVSQAIVFSLWHFNGFPGGAVGIGMVFVWSLFLGAVRHLSRGMLAPVLAHFSADATIALILLFGLNLA